MQFVEMGRLIIAIVWVIENNDTRKALNPLLWIIVVEVIEMLKRVCK